MQVWLFDIDGTLIHSGGAGQNVAARSLEKAFGGQRTSAGVAFAGRTDRAIAQDLFSQNAIPWTESNWLRFRTEYLELLAQSMPRAGGRVLSGARQVITQLQRRADAHVGLLTGNVRDGAEIKLRYFDLWQEFAFGGFGDEHVDRSQVAFAAWKDAEAHLQCRIDPTNIWVVGDTIHDIRCARSIGCRVIGVATGGATWQELQAESPDMLIRDLDALAVLPN